jgi:uncharacterized protein Yka (UPF0111/DUF47 family)
MTWRKTVRRLVRDLTGRGQERFVTLLAAQMEATVRGAQLIRETVIGNRDAKALRTEMRDIEHEGDEQRAGLVAALSDALVTPVDREDLFRLSRAIDDVLDHLRDFSREWDLYQMRPTDRFEPLFATVIDAMDVLRQATGALIDDPAAVSRRALAAKKAGNEMRRLYQVILADLLNADDDRVTATTLKTRELLRRLDIVGLRIRQAADVLADAAVKRSQ